MLEFKQDLKNKSILVVKLTKTGLLTMAKPCNICTNLIKDFKLKYIFYTDKNSNIIKLKTKDL